MITKESIKALCAKLMPDNTIESIKLEAAIFEVTFKSNDDRTVLPLGIYLDMCESFADEGLFPFLIDDTIVVNMESFETTIKFIPVIFGDDDDGPINYQ